MKSFIYSVKFNSSLVRGELVEFKSLEEAISNLYLINEKKFEYDGVVEVVKNELLGSYDVVSSFCLDGMVYDSHLESKESVVLSR